MRAAAAALILSLAAPAAASDLTLALPIDCTLGEDCHIQQYVDRDPGPGAADFTCGPLSYDGHKGTDFALTDLAAMARGVDVLASAAGTVAGIRDGMPDTGYDEATAASIEGRECGNGVLIRHDGGWETQYCHMRQGSVAVRRGDRVQAGDVLGLVGQSGRAQFPHVHLSVRRDGAVTDPFAPEPVEECGAGGEGTLWSDPPAYQPGGLLAVGFNDAVPGYDAVKAGAADRPALPLTAPALVVYAYAWGGRAGDELRLVLTDPQGREVAADSAVLDRDKAQFFRAAGRRLRAAGWPAGRYEGRAELLRDGEIVDSETATLTVE